MLYSLFTKCPDTKKVFGFPLEVAPDTLVKSRRFSRHATEFIEMLDRALDMVESKQVEANMKRLGALHADYNVREEFFPVMGEALFDVLATMLEKDWNKDTQEAWKVVYQKLSSEMIKAMKESQKEAKEQD